MLKWLDASSAQGPSSNSFLTEFRSVIRLTIWCYSQPNGINTLNRCKINSKGLITSILEIWLFNLMTPNTSGDQNHSWSGPCKSLDISIPPPSIYTTKCRTMLIERLLMTQLVDLTSKWWFSTTKLSKVNKLSLNFLKISAPKLVTISRSFARVISARKDLS